MPEPEKRPWGEVESCCFFQRGKIRRHSFVRFEESFLIGLARGRGGDFFLRGKEGEWRSGILGRWAEGGFPFVVRRPCFGGDGESVCVGLALPPGEGKHRLAWEFPLRVVSEVFEPPTWEECGRGRGEGRELAEALRPVEERGFCFRVFGSHAWGHWTGLPYVGESSDVDLLLFLETGEEWALAREALGGVIWPLEPKVDLEIVLRGDASFSWREFCSDSSERLLFKGNTEVWMGKKTDVGKRLQ